MARNEIFRKPKSYFDDMTGIFQRGVNELINNANSFEINVSEDDKGYLVEAFVPGIKKENLKIDFKDEYLTVSYHVERENRKEDQEKTYLHQERIISEDSRRIYLKNGTMAGATAKLEEGVLRITIPKNTEVEEDETIKID